MGKKKVKRSAKRPDLHFGQGGEPSGFTTAGITGFSDLNPAAIVREIMQNSLDAAREGNQAVANIRFEVEKSSLDQIPGIRRYRSVFNRAKQDQQKLRSGHQGLSDQAKDVAQAIEKCLSYEQCTTLFALDNGIGLDGSRMKAILADGLSVKSEASAGAVGNGHFVVIPASDLRYVLYGGLTKQGQMIGSGHAILASHQSDNRRMGNKDGYFVKDLKYDLFDPYIFPQDNEIPEYLRSKLEWIADQWQSGAIVAVPGFNNFRESNNSLWGMISKAAACSFFAAFAQKELRVEVVENGEIQFLDDTTIDTTLNKFRDEKRTHSKFLSGSRALAAFETVQVGQDVTVHTDIGNVSMKLREVTDGKTRIDLCRNGMWITDKLPGKLRESQFTGLKPFHCVLLLDAEDGEIHQLVRKAEGPLHNQLEIKKLTSRDERRKLTKAMEAIASKIREIIPEYDSERLKIPDFLSITSHGIASGGRRSSRVGNFNEVRRRRVVQTADADNVAEDSPDYSESEKNLGGNGGTSPRTEGRNNFRRSGNPLRFRALSVPTAPRSCRVEIMPDEKAAQGEARFMLDEGLDESCDDWGKEDFVRLKTVMVEGCPVIGNALTRNEKGEVLGIRLGTLESGKSIGLEITYELPEEINLPDDVPVVLRTELIRRAATSTKQEAK